LKNSDPDEFSLFSLKFLFICTLAGHFLTLHGNQYLIANVFPLFIECLVLWCSLSRGKTPKNSKASSSVEKLLKNSLSFPFLLFWGGLSSKHLIKLHLNLVKSN